MSEKIADIVAEMRTRSREVKEAFGGRPDGVENMLDIWADRIEAIDSADGWRSLYTPGNAAAMREALVQCELFLGNVSRHGHPTLNPGDKCTACDGVDELREMVVRALAAPARNCDAGTAEEQLSRWKVYCKEGKARCLVQGKWRIINCTVCFADWAQMPYIKEGGGGK